MRTPMPSPRGTNVAGLLLDGGAAAAYDAASGLVDQALMQKIRQFLTGKIEQDEIDDAMALLGSDLRGMDRMPAGRHRVHTQFDRAGRLNRAGMGDHDAEAFARRFPDAAHIKQGY